MKNILLKGGPGTGKTITARAISYYVGQKGQTIDSVYQEDFCADRDAIENYVQSEFVEYIQIHPSMTYDDIVYGIEVTPNGNLTMAYAEKRIKLLCDRASGRTETFFVILDDIGRTNPGRLLGNLLYAMEYRNQPVALADGKTLVIPDNVCFIITECRTIYGAAMEYAIRRRFDYEKELVPDRDVLSRYYAPALPGALIDTVVNVFETICNFVRLHMISDVSVHKENYIPGHGLLMTDRGGTPNEILTRIKQKFEYQVMPYLGQMNASGIIIATEDEMSGFADLILNQINAGQAVSPNLATVEKVFCDTHQPISVFTMADSYQYYVNNILPNGCKEHRTIIECIVDTIFLNGIFPVQKALSDIFLNTGSIGFEHRTRPGTYASFLVDEKEQNNYGYIRPNFRPYHSSRPCKKAGSRWGPVVANGVTLTSGKSTGYKVTYANGTSQVFIALNAFRNAGFDTSVYTIHSYENTASIYCALYHLVNTYLSAYESSLIVMGGMNSDLCKLVGLERRCWKQKNIEAQRQQSGDAKLIYLAQAVLSLRTLQSSVNTTVDVDADKFRDLVSGTTPFSVSAYEDMYHVTGAVKSIVIEGVNTMIDVNDYQRIMEDTGVRQMIFQGPPGTSKTFESKKFVLQQLNPSSPVLAMANPSQEDISVALEDYKLSAADYGDPANSGKLTTGGWDLVQFHPSYGYEDFIRGIDVKPNNGQPVYDSVNRLLGKIAEFAKMAEQAAGIGALPKFYLIIDEINRANLATVFGELIYGLEYRDSKVSTPYEVVDRVINGISKDIVLGKNLFIIGTMNTADKSIDAIDYAIRRRFIFVDSPAKRDVVKACYQGTMGVTDENSIELFLFNSVGELFEDNRFFNEEYQRSDVKIGHTYFLRSSATDYVKRITEKFVFQVVPILREYVKDGILDAYEDKAALEHSVVQIVAAADYEEKTKLFAEEIMLFIKHFGEKDSSLRVMDNQYIADYIEDLCNQMGY